MSALQIAPEMSDADRPRTPFLRSVPARNGLMAAMLVIVGVAALRFASSLLVPITVSMLLALLLGANLFLVAVRSRIARLQSR